MVSNAPDRLQRCGIRRKAGDEVPVNMRKLVAEQAIIHFLGVKYLRQDFRQPAHFLHKLYPLGGGQMKQFRGMAFKDQNRPSGEKLIVVEVGHG